MPLIAQVFALLAALLHGVFFYFESVAFTQPRTWQRFGIRSQADADTIRPMAFNQGFYNLFLAAGVVIGLVLLAMGNLESGRALVLFACACMVGAGCVLVVTDRSLARAAAMQLLPPLLAILSALALR
jgi:putative membrane protein